MRKRVYLYSYIPWFSGRREEIVNKEEKAMSKSKAEEFISNCTRKCSNECCGEGINVGHGVTLSKRCFTPWLTPDQARRAVEIARNEIYEWLKEHADTYTWYNEFKGESGMTEDFISDLKQAMTDE